MKPDFTNIHADIIERCKCNDRTAQQQLFQLYSRPMLNAAYRILGNREDAEDLLQEAFIAMFENIDSYREEASFGAWFKRIVINKSLNRLKTNKKLEGYYAENSLDNLSDSDLEEDIDNVIDYNQFTVDHVKHAMRLLPDGYRIIFNLYMFEDYSHREISDKLGITESTSKSQLNRARKKMRELLLNTHLY